jgi:beta-glucanase (GH16 family)
VITWREEFRAPLDLTTGTTPGTWRTRGADDGGSPDVGWSEYVARNWYVSPAQHPEHNPFTISGSVLTITAKRNPGISGVTNEWISGYLSTEPATSSFTYGYFEVRARMAVPGRGMFPAIWMVNNRIGSDAEDPDKASAEIDLMEVFGDPTGRPWHATIHQKPVPGTATDLGPFPTDTTGWHRYGLLWTADEISLHRDGVRLATASADAATWFRDVDLSIRLDLAMDPVFTGAINSTSTDPAPGVELTLDVDYVRVYDELPADLATGTDDPEPLFPPERQPAPGA